MTTKCSPNSGLASRIPCSPTLASTVKAASSSVTLSGIFEQRFKGTDTISAWGPFDITLSPGLKERSGFVTFPASLTIPELQYPMARAHQDV